MIAQALTLLLTLAALGPTRARPQAMRVSEEAEPAADRRWDEPRDDGLTRIAESFRRSESLNRALLDVLKTLREEELGLLERTLGVDPADEDGWQADQPLEDTVDDSPQELEGGYRGDLPAIGNATANSTRAAPAPTASAVQQPPPAGVQSPKINREKLKELRLATIKNQIMNILWPVGTPPTLGANSSTPSQDLLRAIADKMKTQRASFTPADVYTEKIQSFYPSCDIPRNTDSELWHESDPVNLLFDLVYPSPVRGSKVNIVAAKLRLYKLSQGNVTAVENCPPAESEDSSNSAPSSPPSPSYDDKMIRVSVYWYTRSLKKHRVKRKLLDSQMLSVAGETWTEWNVRGAVKAWRDSGRNFGLAVEVEDEDGTVLPATRYFAPMNCSQEASTSRPIPGFLVARAHTNGTGNMGQALRLDSFLFPMIDLCTVEFPESEKPDTNFYHSAVNSTSAIYNDPPQSVSVNDGERHRIRHQSHKHGQNIPRRHLETVRRDDGDSIEEITFADDIEGHQLRKQIIVQKVIMKSQDERQDNDR